MTDGESESGVRFGLALKLGALKIEFGFGRYK